MTLRMSESEVQAHQARVWSSRIKTLERRIEAATTLPKRPKATRSKVDGKRRMNGLETEFAQLLEYRKQAREIVWYAYEPFRIRLADGCFYRPDFAVVDKYGRTTLYECKGHMREAARLRLRVATEKLPYEFYIVRKIKGELRTSIV